MTSRNLTTNRVEAAARVGPRVKNMLWFIV